VDYPFARFLARIARPEVHDAPRRRCRNLAEVGAAARVGANGGREGNQNAALCHAITRWWRCRSRRWRSVTTANVNSASNPDFPAQSQRYRDNLWGDDPQTRRARQKEAKIRVINGPFQQRLNSLQDILRAPVVKASRWGDFLGRNPALRLTPGLGANHSRFTRRLAFVHKRSRETRDRIARNHPVVLGLLPFLRTRSIGVGKVAR
jgi:hypothetical protein